MESLESCRSLGEGWRMSSKPSIERDSKPKASTLLIGPGVGFVLVPACVLALAVISYARALSAEDRFAEELTIPANLQIAEPQKKSNYTLSASHVQPIMDLIEGMQPGIYNVVLRVNPGEAGMIYLKAFEVTQGT